MSTEADPLLHTCPTCGALLDLSEIEPFTEICCPSCNTSQRVRTRFDNFELLEFIASGGMGSVFKARDVNLNRIIALKVLRKEFSVDADYIAKLETEAKLTASVAHPFVVQVFSFGCDHGVYYIAMELVDKGSLDDLMTLQGRIAEMQGLEIGLQVAQGLRAAYRVGLIHRDVKPGNILFADAHTAKIVDFGLAMPLEKAREGEEEIWGTPYYVAPEKLNHEPEDFRSDIYSLGGTIFHALAGRPPFEAMNASLVALKHLKSQAVSLQAFAPDISSPTAYVINRTLSKNPDDRYQSYDEFIEHLEYARTQLLENAGKARQPKARVVMEDEKQKSVLGYIMLAAIAFMIVSGAVLYMFQDKLTKRYTGAEDLARQQMERSLNSVEQILAAARKQTVSGDAEGALKTLKLLESRQNIPDTLKGWIPFHECVAHLAAGQFWMADESILKFAATQVPNRDRGGDVVKMQQFLQSLNYLLQTRALVNDPAMNRWTTQQVEPIGLLIAGLKEWDASRFESATAQFQKFLGAKPTGNWTWMEDFKPLAQGCLEDYKEFQVVDALVQTADTPEKKALAAKQISALKARLKRPGRLSEELGVYEAALRANSGPAPLKPGQPVSIAVLREQTSKWLSAMQPAEALKEIEAAQLSPADPVARLSLIKKANYIGDLKKLLITDLTRFNTNRWLARRSGPVLFGRVTAANDEKIEIETSGGVVAVPWPDVMPSTVLVWSDCVAGALTATPRLWLSGVYASVAGYSKESHARLVRGAELLPQYTKDISLFEAAP